MKTVFVVLLLCMQMHAEEPKTGEKILWLTGASLTFSAFDYLGYNITKDETGVAPTSYRIVQTLLQLGITYVLYEKCGLPTAIGFNLIWWTFGDDLLYYGYGAMIPNGRGGRFEDRNSFDNVTTYGAHHAWWTPVGLLRTKYDRIPGNTLIAQSLIGMGLAMTITITF